MLKFHAIALVVKVDCRRNVFALHYCVKVPQPGLLVQLEPAPTHLRSQAPSELLRYRKALFATSATPATLSMEMTKCLDLQELFKSTQVAMGILGMDQEQQLLQDSLPVQAH